MELDRLADCPYYLISRVTLLVTSALKKEFASVGADFVKPAYLAVLMSLWSEDGLKVVELARRAGLETSTMTGLLDRMERDSLVSRQPDVHDRRASRIYLTERGRQVQGPVNEVLDRTLATVFYGISKDEVALTKDILKRVLTNASQGSR